MWRVSDTRWKIVLFLVWAGLIAYWIVAAPPPHPTLDRALWRGLVTRNFAGVDPAVVGVFLMLGLTADLFVIFLLRDGRFQRLSGWPFGVASFLFGSFIVVPYLLLRAKTPELDRPAGRITRFASSRPVGWTIVLGMSALAAWALVLGHASAFASAFRASGLVHVMTLDLLFELVLLAALVEESRRLEPPTVEPVTARALRWIPLFGPALWNALVIRRA